MKFSNKLLGRGGGKKRCQQIVSGKDMEEKASWKKTWKKGDSVFVNPVGCLGIQS
jgi:hypothetical protein